MEIITCAGKSVFNHNIIINGGNVLRGFYVHEYGGCLQLWQVAITTGVV